MGLGLVRLIGTMTYYIKTNWTANQMRKKTT